MYDVRRRRPYYRYTKEDMPASAMMMENFFTAIFVFEYCARVYANGRTWMIQFWNVMDGALVGEQGRDLVRRQRPDLDIQFGHVMDGALVGVMGRW